MYARVATYEWRPERVEEARAIFEDGFGRLRDMEGISEAFFLVDSAECEAMTISLWESEDALRASEQAAEEVRERGAAVGGGAVKAVARYEVVLRQAF